MFQSGPPPTGRPTSRSWSRARPGFSSFNPLPADGETNPRRKRRQGLSLHQSFNPLPADGETHPFTVPAGGASRILFQSAPRRRGRPTVRNFQSQQMDAAVFQSAPRRRGDPPSLGHRELFRLSPLVSIRSPPTGRPTAACYCEGAHTAPVSIRSPPTGRPTAPLNLGSSNHSEFQSAPRRRGDPPSESLMYGDDPAHT